MEILIFYIAVLILLAGIWAIAARLYCFLLQAWGRTFGRWRAAKLAATEKRMEKIRTRSMLRDCITWKKEIDDIYESKNKEAESS